MGEVDDVPINTDGESDSVTGSMPNGNGGGDGAGAAGGKPPPPPPGNDRLAALEVLVHQQGDEILCLKTALAEVVRRLGEVEAARPTAKPAGGAPSRTQSVRQQPTSSLPNKPHAPPSATPSAARPQSARTSMARKASSENLSSSGGHGATRPSTATKKIGSKEVAVEKGEGFTKMYLKGRAVTMYAPTEYAQGRTDKVGKEPEEKLVLDWVYGYRGKDCRANLYVLASGEVAYFTAGVAVVMDVAARTQRHYLEHTDDIKSMALHPDRTTVATGQCAGHADVDGKPHVRVWNSATLETLHTFGQGVFNRAVCCLSFSKADGGELLAAVDESNEHVISVWRWAEQGGKQLCEQKGSQDPVGMLEFHPAHNDKLVMCGKNNVTFWTLDDNQRLTKKAGVFEKHAKPKFVTCVAFDAEGQVVSGDTNGNVFFWSLDEHKIKLAIEGANDGPVFAVTVLPDGRVLTAGNKDRAIHLYTSEGEGEERRYAKASTVAVLPEHAGGGRCVVLANEDTLVVGTTKNCILQGALSSTDESQFTQLISSHYEELWGISIHPTEPRVLTGGMDKQIIMWDSEKRSTLWVKTVEYGIMCCAFHPTENVAVFGTSCGRWFAMDLDTRENITLHNDSKEQFDCAAFSPDGTLMAIGSHDNGIYVYKATENARRFTKVGKCIGHTSFVTHLDWSADSAYLMSNSGDYEILYWTANNCKQCIDVQSMRDVTWATHTCVLGYSVIGIWPEGADGTDINSCDRSPDHQFIATADDFGKVKIFNYPSYTPKAAFKAGNGHSSHVTRARFFPDSRTFLTTGGQDTSILQWKIV